MIDGNRLKQNILFSNAMAMTWLINLSIQLTPGLVLHLNIP